MPQIRFLAADGTLLGQIEAIAGSVLLDLARENAIPLHWRCGLGTCGTCRVQAWCNGAPLAQSPGQKERNVLERALGSERAELSPHWRLACQLRVGRDDWLVKLAPASDGDSPRLAQKNHC